MTHTTVREAVTEGRTSAAVERHLAACPSCRSFATAVEHVRELAPTLAGDPPGDLADRIVEDLDARRTGGDGALTFLPSGRQIWTGTVRRVTAVAAALLLVAGLAVVFKHGDEDPTAVVLASAERTFAEGSAEIAVEADVEVVVPVDDDTPDLSNVPVEMHAHVQAQWAEVMARFEAQLEEFKRQVDTTMDEAQRQLEEAQREMRRQMEEATRRMQDPWGDQPDGEPHGGSPPPPSPPSARPALPAPPEIPEGPEVPHREAPTPPSSLSTHVNLRADGTVAFGDRIHLTGRAWTEGSVDPSGFELDVRDDTALYRGPDGTWTALPGPAGPVGELVLDAGALRRVLASAEDTEFVGRSDGLRRYRFRADGGWDAEAWIDGDGRARRIELTGQTEADGTAWRTRVGMRLSGFGGAMPTTSPSPSARAELPAGSSLLLYPFGPNVTASTDAGVDG